MLFLKLLFVVMVYVLDRYRVVVRGEKNNDSERF